MFNHVFFVMRMYSFSVRAHNFRNVESMVHMVKATIGGGFLAMPEAFRHTGVVAGIVGTVSIGLAVLNMMSFIVSISYGVGIDVTDEMLELIELLYNYLPP